MAHSGFINGQMRSVGRKQRSIDINGLDEHMCQIKGFLEEKNEEIKKTLTKVYSSNWKNLEELVRVSESFKKEAAQCHNELTSLQRELFLSHQETAKALKEQIKYLVIVLGITVGVLAGFLVRVLL